MVGHLPNTTRTHLRSAFISARMRPWWISSSLAVARRRGNSPSLPSDGPGDLPGGLEGPEAPLGFLGLVEAGCVGSSPRAPDRRARLSAAAETAAAPTRLPDAGCC